MSDSEHAHEVFIIKRHGGGHEDAHHGGVWKIAFADFMTAMMAFFLVMWLISANDKTKATIASYFNPVKLVDTTTQPKGLEDAKAVESSAPSTKGTKNATAKEAPSRENAKAEAQEASKGGGEEAASRA
jgi:chemotaxis protein MotB